MQRSTLLPLLFLPLLLVACLDDKENNNNNHNNSTNTQNTQNTQNNANNTTHNTTTPNNNTTANNTQNNENNTNNVNNENNPSGEQCNNGIDDDSDGIVDCLDADCVLTAICANHYDRLDATDKEFEALLFTNMARTDPKGFASLYLAGGNDNGAYNDLMGRSPVAPVTLHVNLMSAAREHSTDMSTNCGMQHDSCDGTSWSDRIRAHYSGSTLGENIAWGYTSGQDVVLAWIIDTGVPSLGHRENILKSTYEHMGLGEENNYWTQDFGANGKGTSFPPHEALGGPE